MRASGQGVELDIHVQPGAARSEISGEHGESLKVRVRARAVEGAANEALIDFLAGCLGLGRKEVRILRGEKSRHKAVWAAVSPEEAAKRLMGNNG
ncbi:MAG TPA: DUF167 domain-containing protein [Thiobacillaceae bacterium]|nr:DUF167 domain-containing protein [Thiobacillaceae bacterium]HNA82826.1 DUF167 domain-containing protein [Thiobacillaceae bacterium]HNF89587.1 DUF167 domain-containing protein [Thiobacillaceae bacterium]HNH89600.1 DUF167 domain-containing protein [Thiobacillaceae bacterium]HNI07728.1 DUF167 domain-containing protein [Thiobacillaceae bacterium]